VIDQKNTTLDSEPDPAVFSKGKRNLLSKCLSTVLIVSIVLSIIGISTAQAEPEKNASGNSIVTAVALKSFPPQYLLKKDGTPDGFAIDIMNEVASRAGLRVKYIIVNDWHEAFSLVINGEADLIPNIGITYERDLVLDFTSPIETFPISIIVRENQHTINGKDDLSGLRVAVVKDSAGVDLINKIHGVNSTIFNSPEEALFALLSGNADAFVYPQPVAVNMAKMSGVEDRIKIVGKPLEEIKRAIAVRQGNKELLDRLDKAVKGFIGTPEYKNIYMKWHGKPIPYWTPEKLFVGMFIVVLMTIFSMALWRYRSMVRLNKVLTRSNEERKQAEVALQKTARELTDLYNNAPCGYHSLDINGVFVRINDTELAWLGYSRDELIGKKMFSDLMTPESAEYFHLKFPLLKEQGWFSDIEYEVICKDGTVITLLLSATALRDAEGNFIMSRATSYDISERKKIEKALQVANETLQALIQASPVAIIALDPDGKVRLWNPAAEKMFGWRESEVLGNFLPFISEDKMEEHRAFRDRVLRGEGFSGVEVCRQKKDGSAIDISFSTAPLRDTKGTITGILSAHVDITERRKAEEALRASEEKYRSLFEESKDAVFISTPEGKFIEINPAGIELFGYASKEELLNIDIARDLYVNPEDRKIYQRMLNEKGFGKDYQLEMKRKDGRKVTVLSTSLVVRDEKGSVTAYRGIIRDITEYKKLEEQLLQAQKMEAVGQLAGGVAHDFNNILSAIIGYGYLLQKKMGSDDPLRADVEQIVESANKAAEVTRNLLAFSRKQIMNARPVNINDIITKIEKLLSRLIGEDIEVSTVFAVPDLICTADAGQIEQVLLNLATNARDAMPHGGKLTISTELTTLDDAFVRTHGYGNTGEYALITVSDNGMGMKQEEIEKIFEPFYTTKETGKGTGLGLAMVYGIITQHDGYIIVYSEPGKGTTFRIYLPVARTKEEVPAESAVDAVPARGTETILVAEDDEKLRKLSEIVLTQNGYKVILANDGEEAIGKFIDNKESIQLVLLDIVMPKKGGKEVYDEIRRIRSDIKVIFSSGYTAERLDPNLLLTENINLITKPVSPKDLLARVRAMLDR
jgi:two-component system NtrC family sensor kinase